MIINDQTRYKETLIGDILQSMTKLYVIIEDLDVKKYAPKDCINLIFVNNDGVYNIQNDKDNYEDMLKSAQWFGNRPLHMHWISQEKQEIKIGDVVYSGGKIIVVQDEAELHLINSCNLMGKNGFSKVIATTNSNLSKSVFTISLEDRQQYLNSQYDYVHIRDNGEAVSYHKN
jgi:hypothetical protein